MGFLKKLRCTALLLGFLALPATAGQGEQITATDFLPHKATTEKSNETWSYQFVFDNGTKAFMNIAELYVPGSGRKLGCDLSVWNFKGKSYSVGRQYPPERLKTGSSPAQISIKGEYVLTGLPSKGHRVFFTASKGGDFLLDLTFDSAVKGLKLPGGAAKIGSESYTQFLHIPYGRVSGKLAINGDTVQVKGRAMMDHSIQTAQATDLARRVITFFQNSQSEAFAARLGISKSGELFGYAVKLEGGKPQLVTATEITDDGAKYTGEKFPKGTLEIKWSDGSSTSFSVAKVQEKFSMLNNFDGWLAKKAAKVMMGGEPFFYRGRSKTAEGKTVDWSVMGL